MTLIFEVDKVVTFFNIANLFYIYIPDPITKVSFCLEFEIEINKKSESLIIHVSSATKPLINIHPKENFNRWICYAHISYYTKINILYEV